LFRDGAERSGLLCALSYVIERLKVEQEVDVFHSVKHIRINRPQLVSTYVCLLLCSLYRCSGFCWNFTVKISLVHLQEIVWLDV